MLRQIGKKNFSDKSLAANLNINGTKMKIREFFCMKIEEPYFYLFTFVVKKN